MSRGQVIPIKPHKATHTKTDTIELTAELVRSWKAPPFQRPLRVNNKVQALADALKRDGGVVPGVVTLGILGRDTYLLDGQHRIHAFVMAELGTGYADVRIHRFDDMGEMGEEFVNLNSRLVTLRPDDILRGLEESLPALRSIRQRCQYVGYDMIRRSERAPVLSMSSLLRCWAGSAPEAPVNTLPPAMALAQQLTQDDADAAVAALATMEKAWGRNVEYARLWSSLNLTLCLWLYRRTVITPYSPKTPKLTKELFTKCMMSVSASSDYIDWLVGRRLSERDRSPAYSKLRSLVGKRYEMETGAKAFMPQPAWSKGH